MINQTKLVNSVKYWLEHTIIGHNFCPFAKKEFVNQTIHYEVVDDSNQEEQLLALSHELTRLNGHSEIATTLLILPLGLESFFDYLDFLEIANELLLELGFEGVYQLASFHPSYVFDGCDYDDASNYTNRSPYPILHLLREQSLEKALKHHEKPEEIPEKNITLAEQKGAEYWRGLLKEIKH